MSAIATLEEEVSAMRSGRGFAVLHDVRLTSVTGSEAPAWLNDLLTADLTDLPRHVARRSLLLSPTGRVRADLFVVGNGRHSRLLVQRGGATAVTDLLRPYVLSADVVMEDVERTVIALTGTTDEALSGDVSWSPSLLGVGSDVAVARDAVETARHALGAGGRTEVSEEAVEAARIRAGVPRFGVDLDETSLPAEAGLDDLIDRTKGCFLGQEAVAKVRNLGHPARVLRHLRLEGPLPADRRAFADDRPVGEITSAAPAAVPGSTVMLIRVPWAHRTSPLTCDDGRGLVDDG